MEQATNLDELLQEAVEKGGSDLHISVGAQPSVRIHGTITKLPYRIVDPANAEALIMPLLDTLARSTLNTVGQYDMAYSLRNVARFRVNILSGRPKSV